MCLWCPVGALTEYVSRVCVASFYRPTSWVQALQWGATCRVLRVWMLCGVGLATFVGPKSISECTEIDRRWVLSSPLWLRGLQHGFWRFQRIPWAWSLVWVVHPVWGCSSCDGRAQLHALQWTGGGIRRAAQCWMFFKMGQMGGLKAGGLRWLESPLGAVFEQVWVG